MRIWLTGLISSLIFVSANGHAIEPVFDQQAMFYYQVPLGASNNRDARHNFGFRFDRYAMQPGEVIQYQDLMRQQAVINIQMGYAGLQELQLNGIDYAEYFYVQNEAATEEPGAENTDAGESGEGTATEEKKSGVDAFMNKVPFGVVMGAGILGALLLNND